MTKPTDYPDFATDATYTSGPDVGTPTRVKPTAAELAEGFKNGAAYAPTAQAWNWLAGNVGEWVRHLSALDDLKLGTWIAESPGGAYAGNLLGVASSGTAFVMVGTGPTQMVQASVDGGETWVVRTIAGGYTGDFYSVRRIGNAFVAVGTNGEIQFSTSITGAGWTQATAAGGYTGTFLDVAAGAAGDGAIAVVGTAAEIQTSPDGVTWTKRTAGGGFAGNFQGIAWCGDKYVAVGDSGEIQTSADGITWTRQTEAVTEGLVSVVWNGAIIVVVGAGGSIQTSPDGSTWTARDTDTRYVFTGTWFGVAWNGSRFIAVGAAGEIQTSEDGITWRRRYTDGLVSSDLAAVACDSSGCVIVGQSAEIQRSMRY